MVMFNGARPCDCPAVHSGTIHDSEPYADDAIVPISDLHENASLFTGPEFGCVHGEKK